ncbi:hypothetical protein B566_EDAN016821 [Ephemera danica]|nr:hypothetical protein B566_EDAN016821 [Ephemera danica]
MDKIKRGAHPNFVRTTEEMMALRPSQNQYVLGAFSGGHTPYEAERNIGPNGSPSLVNMTVKAIELLRENKNGFLLVVEGGQMDQAHHQNHARLAMMETEQLDAAVTAALDITGHTDTLLLVTADHSHAMTFTGYNKRGHDILGPYSHLFYGVHEQSYIAHAISCAARIGPDAHYCNLLTSSVRQVRATGFVIVVAIIFLWTCYLTR